jgi:hypothetical protein
MARRPTPVASGPFADWATLGLPAFAAALAPWQDKLTSAALIPAYYQPRISIIASLVGVLVCFCLWLTCRKLKGRSLVRLCLSSLFAFVAAITGCLALNAMVDITWFPEDSALVALQLGWQLLYVTVFATFSAAVAAGLLLK